MSYENSNFNKKDEKALVKTIKKWKKKNKDNRKKIKRLEEIRNYCESPPERTMLYLLWIHYYKKGKEFEIQKYDNDNKAKLVYSCSESGNSIQVLLQHKITTKGGDYRLDFFVITSKNGKEIKFVIEVDSNAFHSSNDKNKNKELMIKDRKRDRDIFFEYKHITIRYMATEIRDKSKKVAKEIFKHTSNLETEL